MNITIVTNVWPPPSPPGLAELQQIVLNELDGGGRQWIGWCIASAVLLGSACFVAHGCLVQCTNTCVVLQARLSGRSGMAATEGPAVPPQAMLRLRCHAVPSNHRAAPVHVIRTPCLLCRPLLTHRFPSIRSLSPPALRILHRRYCKHEDTSSTAATTPAMPLPLAVSVPSDDPPKSSERAIVP